MTATPEDDLRDAVADPALRKEVRDCIGETIPLRRRWVSAIITGPIARLLARALTAEREAATLRAEVERVTADLAKATETYTDEAGAVWGPVPAWLYFATIHASRANRAEATRVRDQAVEALRPLAAIGTAEGRAGKLAFDDPTDPDMVSTKGHQFDEVRDDFGVFVRIAAGDIRKAYATLASLTPKDPA